MRPDLLFRLVIFPFSFPLAQMSLSLSMLRRVGILRTDLFTQLTDHMLSCYLEHCIILFLKRETYFYFYFYFIGRAVHDKLDSTRDT